MLPEVPVCEEELWPPPDEEEELEDDEPEEDVPEEETLTGVSDRNSVFTQP